MIFKFLAGPLIGAAIGYCTNFIAVKMLFYPRHEIRVFGHRLPLTPGAIPKGQKRLAHAIGKIVEEQLLTSEDIRRKLEASETIDSVTNQLLQLTDRTIQDVGIQLMGDKESCELLQERVTQFLTEEILDSVSKLPVAELIVTTGSQVIKEKTAGTMLQMFLSDELIHSITEPVSREIEAYIQENGRTYIEEEVAARTAVLSGQTISQVLTRLEPDVQRQRECIREIYCRIVDTGMKKLSGGLHICDMVEEKIASMAVAELEDLVMTVMKKELNTIVNLGALIGLILGTLNIVF